MMRQRSTEYDARILVVEGNHDDLHLISRLLGQTPISLQVTLATTPDEALAIALGEAGPQGVPDLIILDFDLPDFGSAKLLTQIRKHPERRTMPVVVLTHGNDLSSIRRAYDFGANAVICKPAANEGMGEIVRTIVDFWFRIADRYLLD